MSGWQKAAIFVSGSVIGGLALAFMGVLGAYLWRPELVTALITSPSEARPVQPASVEPDPTGSTEVAVEPALAPPASREAAASYAAASSTT